MPVEPTLYSNTLHMATKTKRASSFTISNIHLNNKNKQTNKQTNKHSMGYLSNHGGIYTCVHDRYHYLAGSNNYVSRGLPSTVKVFPLDPRIS